MKLMVNEPGTRAAACHFLYAPGAGSNIKDPFGQYLSDRLTAEGITTVRFQFPYMEANKRRPDPTRVLEETWREAIHPVRSSAIQLVIGGRSMGGRIASQVVAQGVQVDGLALFAYPLRAPTNPSKWRDGHLPQVRVPTLFCSGTRGSFGTPDELKTAASKVPKSVIHQLEGADHSLAGVKSSGRTRAEVWTEAADSLLSWLHSI